QPVLVPDQNRIAEFLQTVAGIDHDTVFSSLDRRARWDSDIVSGLLLRNRSAKAADDATADRPAHAGDAGCVRSRRCPVDCRLLDWQLGLLRWSIGCNFRLRRFGPDRSRRWLRCRYYLYGGTSCPGSRDRQRLPDTDVAVGKAIGSLQ